MSEPKSPAVINVAEGRWYPSGQQRLNSWLSHVGYVGARLFWTNDVPPGSPTHEDNPYAFKPYAFIEAERRGHDCVLWLDASCWPIKHPGPLFDIIARDGYLLFDCGANVGDWCCDAALALLEGETRESLRATQMVACTIMGLDMRQQVAREFFGRWLAMADRGVFRGPWKNNNGEASTDPTVKGHRHDQVAAGVIARDMGLKLTSSHGLYAYEAYGNWPAETIILTRGM